MAQNKLVLIGNGFDLAHGLKTSYKHFLDWYMCDIFQQFCSSSSYEDALVKIKSNFSNPKFSLPENISTFDQVIKTLNSSQHLIFEYKSLFFQNILASFSNNNWVDIEIYYFKLLKTYFTQQDYFDKKGKVLNLNKELDFLIFKFIDYIKIVNQKMKDLPRLNLSSSKYNINKIFTPTDALFAKTTYLNFNYTDTLINKYNIGNSDVIHIHGRVSEIDTNPIIFGYGDESDPSYQNIEDTGENMYLEHLKSFGYFSTGNYRKLLSFINSDPYSVHIIGHSCGLSDRVLLSEIFENPNCQNIEIFYHVRKDGSDNFKEITQEISRHFKPQNKNLMRRRILNKNNQNTIPQFDSEDNI